MERFDPDRGCPKCNNLAAGRFRHIQALGDIFPARDIMVRVCGYCGYEWDELPLDVKEASDDKGI